MALPIISRNNLLSVKQLVEQTNLNSYLLRGAAKSPEKMRFQPFQRIISAVNFTKGGAGRFKFCDVSMHYNSMVLYKC